jgi:hypothetical protein
MKRSLFSVRRRRVGFIASLLALGLALGASGGCAGKITSGAAQSDSQTGSQSPSQSVSQTVGPAGGTVSTPDGRASVTIPAGELSSDVVVSIDPVAGVTVPGRQVVGPAFVFGPSGITFFVDINVALAVDIPVDGAPGAGAQNIDVVQSGSATSFTALPTGVADATHVSGRTDHFSTFVATAAVAPGSGPQDAGVVGPPSGSNCIVQCEGPENVDGGIGCDCSTTCNGVLYDLQCVCGACTCYQDGVAGTTTSASVSACDLGAMSLMTTYFNTCGYPGAKNAGGGGGPTSNDAGGTCL